MKNIHLIPTDKPSRLWTNNLKRRLELDEFPSQHPTNIAKNIYITSDEEIKEGDYIFNLTSKEVYPIFELWEVVSYEKKIILTTDQDLIKDGVQAIDNYFLEWFVKNPSCERGKIETGKLQIDDDGQEYGFPDMSKYKIIIPKEEQKQDYNGVHLRHCYQGEYEDGCKYGEDDCPAKPLEPKQLTDLEIAIKLEEIEREEYQQELRICKYCGAETTQPDDECYMLRLKQETTGKKFYESADETITVYRQETIKKAAKSYRSSTANKMAIEQQAFQEGAKWQAERMYSEEEVLEIIRQYALEEHLITSSKPDIWFKQYKKK